jgi:cytochrome c
MNSFEFNKIAGAVLGSALLVLGLNELSSGIFNHEGAEKPKGYVVETAQAEETPTGETAAALPLPVLLAKADPALGQSAAKACMACHNLEKGGANKTGPALWNVVGRSMGSADGFAYSEGFTAKKAEKWSYEALNEFIKGPKVYIKGTKMSYAGLKNDEKRANLLAYLATLSDAPVPFPAQ